MSVSAHTPGPWGQSGGPMRRLLDYLLARGWRPVEGRNERVKRLIELHKKQEGK
jgi:hypothetical protein